MRVIQYYNQIDGFYTIIEKDDKILKLVNSQVTELSPFFTTTDLIVSVCVS